MKQRVQKVIDTWGPNGTQPSEIEYKDEMGRIRKDIVNFHGEMVLLLNYSNVNYTGPPHLPSTLSAYKTYDNPAGHDF